MTRTLAPMSYARRDALLAGARDSLDHSYAYLHARRDAERHKAGVSAANATIAGLETAIGALLTGYAAGRLGTTGVGSSAIPLGAIAGLAGLGASVYGVHPKIDGHLMQVSAGVLAGWAALWGAGAGSQAAERAGAGTGQVAIQGAPRRVAMPAAPQTMAAPYARPGQKPLTEAELLGIARAVG